MSRLKFLFLVAILLSGISAFAQKPVGGELAIGARFGGVTALDIKKYNGYNTSALEFMAGWNFDNNVDGFTVTALWEKLSSPQWFKAGKCLPGNWPYHGLW